MHTQGIYIQRGHTHGGGIHKEDIHSEGTYIPREYTHRGYTHGVDIQTERHAHGDIRTEKTYTWSNIHMKGTYTRSDIYTEGNTHGGTRDMHMEGHTYGMKLVDIERPTHEGTCTRRNIHTEGTFIQRNKYGVTYTGTFQTYLCSSLKF